MRRIGAQDQSEHIGKEGAADRIDEADDDRGHDVVAISRILPDRIFIFSDQIVRLSNRKSAGRI